MKIISTKTGAKIQLITKARNLETNEIMVVYQELKEPFEVFVCTQSEFLDITEEMPSHNFNNEPAAEEKNSMESIVGIFLEADTYAKKIEVLESVEDSIEESALEMMALTVDAVLDGDSLQKKYLSLLQFLRTKARFEVNR